MYLPVDTICSQRCCLSHSLNCLHCAALQQEGRGRGAWAGFGAAALAVEERYYGTGDLVEVERAFGRC